MDDHLVYALYKLRSKVIEQKDEVVNQKMCLGSYNRNPCENNNLETVVLDYLLYRQMKASKYMVKVFICAIGCPIAYIKGIAPPRNSNKVKKRGRVMLRH